MNEHPNIAAVYNEQSKVYADFAQSSFSWDYIECPTIDHLLNPIYGEDLMVLDAGCGTGRIIKHLITKGVNNKNIVGIDISKDMLSVARRNLPEVGLIEGDLTETPLLSENFDLIICSMVFRFFDITGLDKVMTNFYRLLKNGGTLFYQDAHPVRVSSDNLNEYFAREWRMEETPWGTKIPVFRRTIADYLNTTSKANFIIEVVHEPKIVCEDAAAEEEYKNYSRTPSRLAVKAKKV